MIRSSSAKRYFSSNIALVDIFTVELKAINSPLRSTLLFKKIFPLILFFISLHSQIVISQTTADINYNCDYNHSCVYGETSTADCLDTTTRLRFSVSYECLYCWQLPEDKYECTKNTTCKLNTRFLTTCRVKTNVHCLGRREFNRYTTCELDTGHRWSLTLVLSILFGGFGVDRFYLGHWQEGVGKLFSFGGFGVWTFIDTILIAIGYLKPADSSRYE